MWNSGKPSAKEVAKTQQKDLKHTSRDLERDVANLDREMGRLETEIRMAAKRGDESGARTLARQLVKMREQRQRMLAMKSHVASSGYAIQSVATQVTMSQAMMRTTSAMATMNRQMNIAGMQKLATAYEGESTKAAMGAEIMDDVYDSVFEGNAEEESSVMNQIYDEIGLECARAAPAAPSKAATATRSVSDEQIEDFIRTQEKAASANRE